MICAFSGHAQPCALTITPPNNTGTNYIGMYPAWWFNNNYAAAKNPSMLTNYVYGDNAGIAKGSYLA